MYYPEDHPKVKEIISLRKKGELIRPISEKVGCSRYLVRKHVKNLHLSDEINELIEAKLKKNNKDFIEKYAKEYDITVPNKITPKFSRILGHLFFDGCLTSSRHIGKYAICYTNASLKQVKYFSKCVQEVFSLTPQKITIKKTKTNAYTVVFASKKLHKFLLTISPKGYSTSKEVGIPSIISEARDPEVKLEFLRTFWADEGSIHHKSLSVSGCSKSRKMIEDLQKLHDFFGIITTLNNCKSRYSSDIRLSSKIDNVALFAKLINFGDAVVIRGFNKERLKKNVLKEKLMGR